MTSAHYFTKGCFEHSNCVKDDLRIFENWGAFCQESYLLVLIDLISLRIG